MSRTDKDMPWWIDRPRQRYWIANRMHAAFARQGRRAARARAKADLRRGVDPSPRYPIERAYYD